MDGHLWIFITEDNGKLHCELTIQLAIVLCSKAFGSLTVLVPFKDPNILWAGMRAQWNCTVRKGRVKGTVCDQQLAITFIASTQLVYALP